MKKIIVFYLLVLNLLNTFAQKENADRNELQLSKTDTSEKIGKSLLQSRLYPNLKVDNVNAIYQNLANEKAVDKTSIDFSQARQTLWKSIGPFNASGNSLGQINSLAIDKDDSKIIYAASAYGGVFVTKDGGLNWSNMYTDEGLPTTGVICIALGQVPAARDKYLFAAHYVIKGVTKGIYRHKTTAVNAWQNINGNLPMSNIGTINKILINPSNINIVFIGTSAGIFRTSNALSASPAWQHVYSHPVNKNIGGLQFDLKDASMNTIIASGKDIIASTDGGSNWQSKTASSNGIANLNLGNRQLETINISSEGNFIYAYVCLTRTSSGFGYYIFRFDKNAGTWTRGWLSPDSPNGQGPNYMSMLALPSHPDVVFFAGYNFRRSSNGGNTLSGFIDYFDQNLHADQHDIVYADNCIYVASDGGVSKCNVQNGNFTFQNINGDGLAVATPVSVSSNPLNAANLQIGMLDNGSSESLNSGQAWARIGGSDGGTQLIVDNNLKLSSIYYYLSPLSITTNGSWGSATRSIKPCGAWAKNNYNILSLKPGTTNQVYTTWNDLWLMENPMTATNNNGWTSATGCDPAEVGWKRLSYIYANPVYANCNCNQRIAALGLCESDPNTIYLNMLVISNPTLLPIRQDLFKSTVGGEPNGANPGNWTKLNFPPISGTIVSIVVDPVNRNKVWVCGKGYGTTTTQSHVMQSMDGGNTWIDKSLGLPNLPVNKIIYINGNSDNLFAATDIGVFQWVSNANRWYKLGVGLPHIIVEDIEYHKQSNRLRAATLGRGVWEYQF